MLDIAHTLIVEKRVNYKFTDPYPLKDTSPNKTENLQLFFLTIPASYIYFLKLNSPVNFNYFTCDAGFHVAHNWLTDGLTIAKHYPGPTANK